jgi:hypothetical protein
LQLLLSSFAFLGLVSFVKKVITISFKVKLPQERFSGINEWSAARLTTMKIMSFLKRKISALSSDEERQNYNGIYLGY